MRQLLTKKLPPPLASKQQHVLVILVMVWFISRSLYLKILNLAKGWNADVKHLESPVNYKLKTNPQNKQRQNCLRPYKTLSEKIRSHTIQKMKVTRQKNIERNCFARVTLHFYHTYAYIMLRNDTKDKNKYIVIIMSSPTRTYSPNYSISSVTSFCFHISKDSCSKMESLLNTWTFPLLAIKKNSAIQNHRFVATCKISTKTCCYEATKAKLLCCYEDCFFILFLPLLLKLSLSVAVSIMP